MSACRVVSSDSPRVRLAGSCLAAVALFLATSTLSLAETRGYVIQWIHTASYPQKDNCPQGGNGGRVDIERRILLTRGYTQEQAKKILDGYDPAAANNGVTKPFDFEKIGTLFGQPADVLNFPTSVPDSHIETAQGRFMYGFDLTGKPTPYAFEDPDTHEMVEDQMWRVLGCFDEYHIPLSIIPYNEAIGWDTEEDAMPAWLISISGADLNQDGDVTVTFDRALNVISRNTYGGALHSASYTIDPDLRSHSTFRGHIKDHVVTIEPGNFYLLGELPKFYPVLRFSQAHLRLKLNPDQSSLHYGGGGVVSGFIGGYQPWMDYFRYLAVRNIDNVDIAGIYYAMKHLADGVPDPVTGQNTAISAVYYFEAAPVFLTKERSAVVNASATTSDRTEVPKAPPTTPQGITIVEVARELNLSEPQVLWLRPGDANGRTVLVYDKDGADVSNCVSACAQQFPPLLAPAGSKAFGDWSLVRRPDGSRQWAYQSRPLYTWVKETIPDEVATNVGLTETANLKIAEDPAKIGSLLPPASWHVPHFEFAASVPLPNGIEVGLVPSAQGVALINSNGLTVYAFDGDARRDHQVCAASGCELQWLAVAAPELASAVGDFSVVTRADGSKQWAYRKRPLYLYQGDKLPGDARGIGVDRKWNVAVVTENFRPRGVSITSLEGYGDVLSLDGRTLYGGHPFESRNGGRSLRASFANLYGKDKRLGVAGCTDAACLKSWHPFLAPADAQSSGFWEPIRRPDGTRQWAYKGCALYTYAGDRTPGDHNGQGINDFVKIEGSDSDLKNALFFVDFGPRGTGGLGVYWNVAKP